MIKIAILENNITSTLSMRAKLSKELMLAGYDITILTTGSEENLKLAKNEGYKIIDVGASVQNPIHILQYLWKLYKALKECKADICLTFTIRPAIWGNVITRLLKIPTITNITGIGPLFERNDIAYRGARVLYRFVLSSTRKIFFQNEDDKNIFIENRFANESKVEVVPGSGVDYEYYAPIEKSIQTTNFKFLFISRLIKDKGIMEFLESAHKLRQEFKHIECQILGPFWNQNLKNNTLSEDELKHWIDAGDVIYLGEHTDVRPFVSNADCIVLPSYREGTSNVLLEACSMGKPCVTCNVTGCKEVIEDGVNGFLCKPKDAESLYQSMKKMFEVTEEERIKMGKLGRQKMIEQFDKKIVINKYLAAIREIHEK